MNIEEKDDDNTNNVQIHKTANYNKELKCEHCDFKCEREVTLKKHTNTMHPVTMTQNSNPSKNEQKCCLCDFKFNRDEKFNNHLQNHLNEKNGMEPVTQFDI